MLAGISIWQLVIVLVIVMLLFGTRKLRAIGGDLGGAVNGFRQALNNADAGQPRSSTAESKQDA